MYTSQGSEQHPQRRSSPVQSMVVSFRNASNACNARWALRGTHADSRDISDYHSAVTEGSRLCCSDALSLGWGVPEISQDFVAFRFKGLFDP